MRLRHGYDADNDQSYSSLAEPARILLAVAGATYEDKRWPIGKDANGKYIKDEFDAAAAAGLAPSNLNRLPVITMDGAEIGGSKPVCRAIASAFGLAGTGFAEEGLVDTICEIVSDIKAAGRAEEDRDKWFENGGTAQYDRYLPWFLGGLEKLVGSAGYAVGSSTTMADVMIFNLFGDTCNVTNFGKGDSIAEPMGDLVKMNAALAAHAPNVKKLIETFAATPNVRAYLASRSTTMPF